MIPEDTRLVLGFFGGGLWVFRVSVSQPSAMMSKALYVGLSVPSPQHDSISVYPNCDLQHSLKVALPLTLHPIAPTHIHEGILNQRLTVTEAG